MQSLRCCERQTESCQARWQSAGREPVASSIEVLQTCTNALLLGVSRAAWSSPCSRQVKLAASTLLTLTGWFQQQRSRLTSARVMQWLNISGGFSSKRLGLPHLSDRLVVTSRKSELADTLTAAICILSTIMSGSRRSRTQVMEDFTLR